MTRNKCVEGLDGFSQSFIQVDESIFCAFFSNDVRGKKEWKKLEEKSSTEQHSQPKNYRNTPKTLKKDLLTRCWSSAKLRRRRT